MLFDFPLESSLYPNQLVIALLSSIVFLIILEGYRRYFHEVKSDANKWDRSDSLTAIGIVAAAIGTILFPFFQFPILDYNVSQTNDHGNVTVKIEIANRGLASANNVLVSLSAKGITFENVITEPFQPSKVNFTPGRIDNTEIAIKVIPPAAHETLYLKLNSYPDNQRIKTYVRSDERVGYNNALVMIIFHISLFVIYALIFIYLFYWNKLRGYYIGKSRLTYKDKFPFNRENLVKNWKSPQSRKASEIVVYFTITVLYTFLFVWSYGWFLNAEPTDLFPDTVKVIVELVLTLAVLVVSLRAFSVWK